MPNHSLADAAVAVAAEFDVPVFPCSGRTKGPTRPTSEGGRGWRDATRDPDAIRWLWEHWPGLLIGVATGPAPAGAGFDALDIDPRHGGHLWLAEHAAEIPQTRTHRTRGGGWHFLFRADSRLHCSEHRIARGIDVRATGGYVIWWPAAGLDDVANPEILAEWPTWLLGRLLPPERPAASQPAAGLPGVVTAPGYVLAALARECDAIRVADIGTAGSGARNQAVFLAALRLSRFVLGRTLAEPVLVESLTAAGREAGLGDAEISRAIANALKARSDGLREPMRRTAA